MPFNPIDIHYHSRNVTSDDKESRGNYESSLDLNEYCISHPSSTFFVKTESNAMESAGIYSGDLLIVDRAAKPASGRIVLAIIAGEFMLRRVALKNRRVFLTAENDEVFELTPDTDASLWGVVIGVIRKF
jgi:DNA polymerase V